MEKKFIDGTLPGITGSKLLSVAPRPSHLPTRVANPNYNNGSWIIANWKFGHLLIHGYLRHVCEVDDQTKEDIEFIYWHPGQERWRREEHCINCEFDVYDPIL